MKHWERSVVPVYDSSDKLVFVTTEDLARIQASSLLSHTGEPMLNGNKIGAIKMVRQLYQLGLKEAKEFVETLAEDAALPAGCRWISQDVKERANEIEDDLRTYEEP